MTKIEKFLSALLLVCVVAIYVMYNKYSIINERYEEEKVQLLKEVKKSNKKYIQTRKEALTFKSKWEHADSLLKEPRQYEEIEVEYIQTIDSIDNADWNELQRLWSE